MTALTQTRAFTVAEYHRMAQSGILTEQDRVELIGGRVVCMSPIGSRHAGVLKHLNHLLSQRVGERAIISVQDPVHLDDYSEPQPDLAVLRPRADFYMGGHPGPADVLLLIEVADTFGDYDRQVKVPVYARASVPEVWLVDLVQDCGQIHVRPEQGAYQEVLSLRSGARVSPRLLADLNLSVDQLLGRDVGAAP